MPVDQPLPAQVRLPSRAARTAAKEPTNVARALRIVAALVIGTLTAVLEPACLLVAAPLALLCLPHPAARRAGERVLRAVAARLASELGMGDAVVPRAVPAAGAGAGGVGRG
ncbi:hypothetical protein ACQP2K_43095 [Microbispora siamensis]